MYQFWLTDLKNSQSSSTFEGWKQILKTKELSLRSNKTNQFLMKFLGYLRLTLHSSLHLSISYLHHMDFHFSLFHYRLLLLEHSCITCTGNEMWKEFHLSWSYLALELLVSLSFSSTCFFDFFSDNEYFPLIFTNKNSCLIENMHFNCFISILHNFGWINWVLRKSENRLFNHFQYQPKMTLWRQVRKLRKTKKEGRKILNESETMRISRSLKMNKI